MSDSPSPSSSRLRGRLLHATRFALIVVTAAGTAKADEGPSGAADLLPVTAPAGRGARATTADPAEAHDLRSSISSEPKVEELCRAAVALALAEPERARSFLLRARLAGWLPELRFRLFRRFARTEGLTLDDTVASTPLDVSAVDDVRYEWRATWDLSRMVFNSDELQAHSEALRMADVRRDIQSLVVRLYFERRRLLVGPPRVASAVAAAEAEEHRWLRLSELEAQLEALTGRDFFHATGGSMGEARP
jgi:hypothetical protein